MDDLLEEFIAETAEMLETLSGQLIDWEKDPSDLALIDSVFRFVHTVKGSCGFLDLPRLEKLSHAAEDVLGAAREGTLKASQDLVTAILAVVDRIGELNMALGSGNSVRDDDDELIARMLAFLPDRSKETADADQDQPGGSGSQSFENSIEQEAVPPSFAKARTVRVSLQLLDELMSGVSDLVLSRNEVSRQLRTSGNESEIGPSFSRLSLIVADIRDSISQMRMQNIDRLFSTLPRLMRDISLELDKKTELRISGSQVEIDREMVEALRDPLTHILRNAVDHGIESEADRIAAGKDPEGLITVCARQSGNQILIEIADDGRGIDLDALRRKAIAGRVITLEDWAKLPEDSQLTMIFEPGITTAPEVTSISGRGVGMDVVRSNIQSIGGNIDLENCLGQGLKITLRLPLTLSIIAGLSVEVCRQVYGLSRNSVEEIISVSSSSVKIEQVGGVKVASIRGNRFPYSRLEDLLGIDGATESLSRTLVVIKPAVGSRFALDVERVIDHEELVVKPGSPLVMQSGLYSGVSLPDNGRPMLLLDASGLASAIGCGQETVRSDTTDADSGELDSVAPKGDSALLFENLAGRKQAVRLAAIDRMEEASAKQVRDVGGKLRVAIGDDLFELVGIDKVPEEGTLQILRISDGLEQKCMAVGEIIDMFTLEGKIEPSADPDRHEGVVEALGEHVELINILRYFGNSALGDHSRQGEEALCFIAAPDNNGWERGILGPLLATAGYRVSYDPADSDQAAVILGRADDKTIPDKEPRAIRLREAMQSNDVDAGSIYRHDRTGLLAAIEDKIAGAR